VSKSPDPVNAKRRLSRDVICEAALNLLAETDASSFSLRALGERLGVDATAFYRHFADKDDLLREVGDRALAPATLAFAATESPQDDARRLCLGLRRALLKNQVALTITSEGPTRHTNELRITEILLDAALRAGLDSEHAVLGYHVLIEYTVGSASLDSRLAASATLRRDTYRRWRSDYQALPVSEYPASTRLASALYPSSERVFQAGLDALIAQLMPVAPGQ
jgi:AcrR family transcriptional regulator